MVARVGEGGVGGVGGVGTGKAAGKSRQVNANVFVKTTLQETTF